MSRWAEAMSTEGLASFSWPAASSNLQTFYGDDYYSMHKILDVGMLSCNNVTNGELTPALRSGFHPIEISE